MLRAGELLNVETVPVNYTVMYAGPREPLNADASYCCLDFQGRWTVTVTRLFMVEDTARASTEEKKIQLRESLLLLRSPPGVTLNNAIVMIPDSSSCSLDSSLVS